MKRFKVIDFWISVVLIFLSVMYAAKDGVNFLAGYFVVGGWQVISMLVHFFKQWFCAPGSRRYKYQWAVLILILCALLGLAVFPILMILCVILFFAAPVMALYYSWLCYEEIHVKMKRPLDQLK